MKKSIFCLLLLALLMQMMPVAFAEDDMTAEVDLATAVVTVTGTLPDAEEPTALTLVALNPGYTAEAITEAEFNEGVNYIAYLTTDNEGRYSYRYQMSGVMGEYQLLVVRGDTEAVIAAAKPFMFYSNDDLEKIAARFNGDLTATAIDSLLETYAAIFPAESAEKRSAIASYLAADKAVNGDFADYADLQRAYREALVFLKLQAAETTEVFAQVMADNEALLPFKDSAAMTAYREVLEETGRDTVLGALVAAKVSHVSEYGMLFTEKSILTAVSTMPNWRKLESVLDANRSVLKELNYTAYDALRSAGTNEKADRAVAGKSYASLSALCTAVNRAIADANESSSGNTSSSRPSGGGSVGSGGGSIISTTPKNTGSQNGASAADNAAFCDLDTAAWAIEAVNYLTELGIVSGRDAQSFDPQAMVTREEFVKMAALAMGLTESDSEIAFTDVPQHAWYYPYIKAAYGQGLVTGVDDTSFGVGLPITREDMAVILCRAMEKKTELKAGTTKFSDNDEIAPYALPCVQKLTKAGIIGGMGDGSFAPKNNATRAQAAAMLYHVLTYKEGK